MFEDIVESRNRSGLRGFAYRHFGTIADADQALDEIKLYSGVFFVLGSIGFVVGLISLVGGKNDANALLRSIGILFVAVLILTLAGVVRVGASRVGALLLFALEVLNVLSVSLISILWAALAWRLVQACFAFQRLSREKQSPAPSTDVPPAPPPSPPPLPPPVAGV